MTTDVIDISTRLNAALKEPPPPGVYADIPEHVYHSWWPCASNHRLGLLKRSPAHLKAKIDFPDNDDTESKRFGRASHCAILEPDEFEKRYGCAPAGDGRSKAVQQAKAQLELQYGPGRVLKPDDFADCLRIRDAIHRHPLAGPLIRSATARELTVVWNDAETGVRVKARLDARGAIAARGVIIDAKSTEDARLDPFERSVYKYGYHRQGALYLEGANAHGFDADDYVIIAYEKEPPYALIVYRMTEGALDLGTEDNRRLLARYAQCLERNEWPAYDDSRVHDVAVPPWAWEKGDQDINQEST